jgi:regulator of protease activity HflC (stomatin/prohibitin superfamily)
MQKLAKILVGCFVAVLLFFIVAGALLERVPPATIGVKQNMLGGGIVEEDYGTGFHVGVTGVHKWHLLDGTMHFLTYAQRSSGKGSGTERPVLDIRTKDNNFAFFDVTVTYKIKKDEAYLIIKDGLKDAYRERVRARVISTLREELAELTSEDLQITELRLSRAQDTLALLTQELAEYHVVPENLFIRKVKFPAQYETKLQEKQLLRQESQLESALTEQAKVEQVVKTQTRRIAAEALAEEKNWDRKIQEKRSDYQVQIAQINADALLYARTTIAEGEAERDIAIARGNLALEKADALRDLLRNEALDSVGGRILLALTAVENLQIPEVTLNSEDPAVPMLLDLSKMTRLLVGDQIPIPGKN